MHRSSGTAATMPTMRRTLVFALCAACGILGAAAAVLIAPATASAWDWHGLPSGYQVSSYQTCYDEHAGDGIDHWPNCGSIPVCDHLTIQSSAGSFTEADCVPSFQDDLDRYVAATICTVNPAAGGQACAPATTATTTTTAATTTAPATTTAQTTTTATTTVAQTTTVAETTTVTTTVDTVSQRLDLLEARLAALEQQLAALTTRVDRIEPAVQAAWLAYEQAVQGGADPATAADVARGTYMNAIYGLGDFA